MTSIINWWCNDDKYKLSRWQSSLSLSKTTTNERTNDYKWKSFWKIIHFSGARDWWLPLDVCYYCNVFVVAAAADWLMTIWYSYSIARRRYFKWPVIKSWNCNNQFHVFPSPLRRGQFQCVHNTTVCTIFISAWLLMWQFVPTKYLLISQSFPFFFSVFSEKYSEHC